MPISAGELDRRIEIEVAAKSTDAANDEVLTWSRAFKLWAAQKTSTGGEKQGAQQTIRDADTIFKVRWSTESRSIAPESHRVRYRGAIYEIVAITETNDGRLDGLNLLCSSRPDLVGARGRETTSDGSP